MVFHATVPGAAANFIVLVEVVGSTNSSSAPAHGNPALEKCRSWARLGDASVASGLVHLGR
jgi:hypothetical protein